MTTSSNEKRVPVEKDEVLYERAKTGRAVKAKVVKVLSPNSYKSTLVLNVANPRSDEGQPFEVVAPFAPNQAGGWAWPAPEKLEEKDDAPAENLPASSRERDEPARGNRGNGWVSKEKKAE